jgi:hypothetical protein
MATMFMLRIVSRMAAKASCPTFPFGEVAGVDICLRDKLVDVDRAGTHKAIGSAYGHINVVLREHPANNIGEAGEPGRAVISKRNAKKAAEPGRQKVA